MIGLRFVQAQRVLPLNLPETKITSGNFYGIVEDVVGRSKRTGPGIQVGWEAYLGIAAMWIRDGGASTSPRT